jgi:hypothetical protein
MRNLRGMAGVSRPRMPASSLKNYKYQGLTPVCSIDTRQVDGAKKKKSQKRKK